jgi:CRISPR-associated protein (TIGR02710 family)
VARGNERKSIVLVSERSWNAPLINRDPVLFTTMKENVLICTVGGSHQPVVTAIRETDPLFVCFLCTDRDPVTGQPGSRVQVEGKGSVIKAHRDDTAPSLPNIPSQAGLEPDRYGVWVVPADDLDGVVSETLKLISELREQFPDAFLLADYTGGTKTMTAGLVMAALETEDVELRLVTGARGDLIKVHDGTERSIAASAEGVRLRRAMAPNLAAWGRYSYGEAANGLARLPAPRDPRLRAELQIAHDLSAAFDDWDRFDHGRALQRLRVYRPRIGARAGRLLKFLELLASHGDKRQEPARLMDLWGNAQRRAAQGRYDDAVGRAYRLLEWTAQWLLRTRAGIEDTGDIPEDKVVQGIGMQHNRDGKWQAGLFAAWGLVEHLLSGEPERFACDERKRLLDHLSARNTSILAHGFTPIDAEVWRRFESWMEAVFVPMLIGTAAEQGVRMGLPELPTEPIWEDAGG